MARIKKSIPKDVQNARKRIDGLRSIDPELDLGNGVSITTIEASIKKVIDEISEYNTMLSSVDQKSNDIETGTKAMNELSSRALKGVEFKYGKDSDEYEMAGGTRTSDRKKSVKKSGGGGGEAQKI